MSIRLYVKHVWTALTCYQLLMVVILVLVPLAKTIVLPVLVCLVVRLRARGGQKDIGMLLLVNLFKRSSFFLLTFIDVHN